jgi:hypothetical protein
LPHSPVAERLDAVTQLVDEAGPVAVALVTAHPELTHLRHRVEKLRIVGAVRRQHRRRPILGQPQPTCENRNLAEIPLSRPDLGQLEVAEELGARGRAHYVPGVRIAADDGQLAAHEKGVGAR